MKIVIGGLFPPGATEMFLEQLPRDWDIEVLTAEEVKKRTDLEVLISRNIQIDAGLIERNPGLKFIQVWGTGLDFIDLKAAGEHGVPVCNVPGANAYAVSELTIMLMLAVYRNMLYHNSRIRAGVWSKPDRIERTFCLLGKTVGIIGGGNIGRLVAKKVQAFEAKTVYYDAFRMDEKTEKELGMTYLPLDELLKVSDIVTLHIPLLDSTKNFMSKPQFDMMKDNAVLINAARGGLVNEPDLLAALDSGKLLGAGLDCLCHEYDQLNADDPMLHNDKITVMPHIGGSSSDLAQIMVPRMVENVVRFVKGESPLWVANKADLR